MRRSKPGCFTAWAAITFYSKSRQQQQWHHPIGPLATRIALPSIPPVIPTSLHFALFFSSYFFAYQSYISALIPVASEHSEPSAFACLNAQLSILRSLPTLRSSDLSWSSPALHVTPNRSSFVVGGIAV